MPYKLPFPSIASSPSGLAPFSPSKANQILTRSDAGLYLKNVPALTSWPPYTVVPYRLPAVSKIIPPAGIAPSVGAPAKLCKRVKVYVWDWLDAGKNKPAASNSRKTFLACLPVREPLPRALNMPPLSKFVVRSVRIQRGFRPELGNAPVEPFSKLKLYLIDSAQSPPPSGVNLNAVPHPAWKQPVPPPAYVAP